HVAEGVPGDAAILLPDATDRVTRQAAEPPEFDLDERERAVAQWAFAHNQLAGRGTATLAGAGALYLPLSASQGAVGVLALRPADPRALDAPEQLHYLGTFASQIALAIERAILAERAHQAQLTMEAERLRNALLSAVSHDLRTPLAGIRGAATGLVTGGEALDAVTRAELAESIADEAERLDRLLGNLLDMTRLEAGVVQPKREWHPLEEIVGAALARLAAPLRDRPVQVSIPADLPLVCIDGSLIEISATAGEAQVTVEVADRGAGLLPGEAERIFEKFRRGTGGRAEGTGLGLTICRGFVAAHGGRIWAENRPGGGARFRFDLPIDQAPPRM